MISHAFLWNDHICAILMSVLMCFSEADMTQKGQQECGFKSVIKYEPIWASTPVIIIDVKNKGKKALSLTGQFIQPTNTTGLNYK